ncbi:lymphotoxin-alpha isoform X1 [Bombina bombina]|uniref:lymphotoxin-alpha isoform X1 n=1 Tax=Bombina bombina TaxID=8345 RepID=UPI00235ADB32|nr:lymphotoxin-alpha isoform X1 [Bombina bombina]
MPATLPRNLQGFTELSKRLFVGYLVTQLYLSCQVTSSPTQREAKTAQKVPDRQGDHLKNTKDNKKPAAHFEADPFSQHRLIWRSDTDNSFTRGGLLLSNNTLRIVNDGLYFVYTQATFEGRGCPHGISISLSHGVALLSGQYPEETPLLSAQKTACGDLARGKTMSPSVLSSLGIVGPVWSRAIFQGGVFSLEEGDLLYTVTEGTDYVRLGPGEAYFGVYAL